MLLVALEGIDGSGKGTQARLLCSWLREKGYTCHLTAEPTESEIGTLIRRYLGELADSRIMALLFAADRAHHLREIMAQLEAGSIVVTERYLYSSIAYQGALGMERSWLEQINSFAPQADIVFYLDVDIGTAMQRIASLNSFRREREMESYENEEFLKKVRGIYLEVAEERDNFEVIDANKGIKEVQSDIRRRLGRMLSFMREEERVRQTRLEELL